MTRFNPTDVDHLLEQPASQPTPSDLPDDFFATMERRILAATVEAEQCTAEAEQPTAETKQSADTTVAPFTPKLHIRRAHPLWYAAAAAVLLLVCGVTLKYLPHHDALTNPETVQTYDIDNIYAVTDNTDDGEIDILEDIYEADIFLEEL